MSIHAVRTSSHYVAVKLPSDRIVYIDAEVLQQAIDMEQVNAAIGAAIAAHVQESNPHPQYSLSSNSALIKIPFSYGDASPKVICAIAAGTTIFTAQVVIATPFNGIGSALTLGDAASGDRLVSASQNDPTYRAEYETNPGYTYSSETEILLSITPGEGCTQGAGYILLEV